MALFSHLAKPHSGSRPPRSVQEDVGGVSSGGGDTPYQLQSAIV
jgi:hypothetical protein